MAEDKTDGNSEFSIATRWATLVTPNFVNSVLSQKFKIRPSTPKFPNALLYSTMRNESNQSKTSACVHWWRKNFMKTDCNSRSSSSNSSSGSRISCGGRFCSWSPFSESSSFNSKTTLVDEGLSSIDSFKLVAEPLIVGLKGDFSTFDADGSPFEDKLLRRLAKADFKSA
uniref:Uncharacterized protein n=1 Tax=Romanomermis culicivorax TaxID=13658 RepID=A0A915IUQ0_ROMCU